MMGRHKEKNTDLPPNMYKRGPSYYHARPTGWVRLSRDKEEALRLRAEILAAEGRADNCTEEVNLAQRLAKMDAQFFPGCGVYMLMDGEQVVYVGRSSCVAARVATHWGEKEFDSVVSFQVEPHRLAEVEYALIRHFTPKYNKEANPEYSGSEADFSGEPA